MPVVVTAVFTPKADAFDQVVAALKPAIAEVHEEPGCLLYAIHEAPNGQIIMIESWESAELLDSHGAGEAVKRLNVALDGLLEGPVEVTRLVPIPAGNELQGAL
ncbi:putative quinol monooxygenase [Cryobacterium tagatosivorans]|uniref:Antibiotic biosynthesis monooxygenase n=1 Tax=Cryobacterium tagatosivorans TaxID=1259199 RepID=A0A4R8UFI4_9MICO|nr:putative quinol monooxygenase [Cryobacterium tagatosivorans]TFB50319.1 antibiotic biosynthesis monooxygenase [Cryobacterium tagatosivorans]